MDTIPSGDVQQESRLLRQLAESLRRASLERFVAKRAAPAQPAPKPASDREAKAA